MPFATHVSCTIEMTSTTREWDVAVIDEIQMIGNPQRGQAWTRALLGLRAREVVVVVVRRESSPPSFFVVSTASSVRRRVCVVGLSSRPRRRFRRLVSVVVSSSRPRRRFRCLVYVVGSSSRLQRRFVAAFASSFRRRLGRVVASFAVVWGVTSRRGRISSRRLRLCRTRSTEKGSAVSATALPTHHGRSPSHHLIARRRSRHTDAPAALARSGGGGGGGGGGRLDSTRIARPSPSTPSCTCAAGWRPRSSCARSASRRATRSS